MCIIRPIVFLVVSALSAHATMVTFSGQAYFQPTSGVDTITFSNIVLGSPLLITRLDLTIGNGINNVSGSRSLFFDLPGGPAGFGTANAYAAVGNGLITGIQSVDTPGDGLSDRTLAVTYTSWVSGGVFTISLDVDRLSNSFSQGSGGTNCNNCDNINGQDFVNGGAISFRLWLSSADSGQIIAQPNYIDIPASQWSRTSSNDAVVTWNTQFDVQPAAPEPVPEPGSFLLCAAALITFGYWRRSCTARSHSRKKENS